MNKKTFSTYVAAFEQLKKDVASGRVDLDRPKLIIVPEIYTFAAEKQFYSMGRGSFDVRICSFSRLYYDLLPNGNAISKAEAIAIISKIAADNAANLSYYSKAFQRRGFSEKVYEIVDKLSAANVSPDELQTNDVLLNNKLNDLRLVYGEYRKITDNSLSDANGRIDELSRFIENNVTYIDKSEIYCVNFDVFTARQRALLQAMDKKALSLTIYESKMIEGYKDVVKPTVYAASSMQDEYERVADFIRLDVMMDDMRFGDVSVVGENIDYERLKRVFDSRGINFYYDKKKSLLHSEPGILIERIMHCIEAGPSMENMSLLAGNRIAVPDKKERDVFLRYIRANSAFYVSKVTQFDRQDKDCESAEETRKVLVSLIDKFPHTSQFSAEEILRSTNELFEKVSLTDEDEENGRYCALIKQCAQSLVKIFGEKEYPAGTLFSTFKNMLESTNVSIIPNRTDTVFVGAINSRRGFECKKLYVMGFNEGVLPSYSEDTGILSDADAGELKKCGIIVEPLIEDMNARKRDELMQLLCSASKLTISYVSNGESKKSYLLRIIENAIGMTEQDEEWQGKVFLSEKPTTEQLVRAYPSEATCLKAVFTQGDKQAIAPIKKAVEHKVNEIKEQVLAAEEGIKGGVKVAKCSSTSITTYFDCPKKYFYEYTLGIKKPKDGKIKSNDVGNVLHKIIEKYVNEKDFSEPEKKGEEIAKKVLEEEKVFSLPQNAKLAKYIVRDAVFLCKKAAMQLTDGRFSCKQTELSFGDVNNNAQVEFQIDGVPFAGKIDRVDVTDDNYVRVIDYKSGSSVELKEQNIYYGNKLQLPLYLAVVKNMGYQPAGMFYFPINDDEDAGLLKGYCLDEESVWSSNVQETYACEKNGKIKNRKDAGELQSIMDYALKVTKKALSEIRNGYNEATPKGQGDKCVCGYCDYAAVCKGKKRGRKFSSKVNFGQLVEASKDEVYGQSESGDRE